MTCVIYDPLSAMRLPSNNSTDKCVSKTHIQQTLGGGSYNYAQAQHPAPFSRATSPSLIVCLYLASSKLLKLEINMHHLRMAMQYRQAVNPLSEFGEILCR